MKEHPAARVIGILQTLPLGHKPPQRGPQGRMIVLTAIEAAMDIGLTPRDRVGHQLAVDQPKNSTSGTEARRDRWTAKLRAWTALIRWTADIVSSQWVSSRPYKFNAGREKFTGDYFDLRPLT